MLFQPNTTRKKLWLHPHPFQKRPCGEPILLLSPDYNEIPHVLLSPTSPASSQGCVRKDWVQILNFHPCQGLKIFYFCGVSGDPLGRLTIYSQGTLFLPCWDGVRGGLRKSQDFCQGPGIIAILLWWRLHGEKAWTPTLSSSNKEPLLPRGVKEAKWRTYTFHYYLTMRRLSPHLPVKSCDRRDLLKHEI